MTVFIYKERPINQSLWVPLSMLVILASYLALSTVLIGGIELVCFRCREVGQAAKRRKQYVNNVVKGVLPGLSGALVAVLVLEPGVGNEILPGFPTYSAAVSLIAVIVVAVISYRLEVSSEAPSTIHDLYSDLRYLWTEEMILSRHSLVRHRTWLEGFKATNGGRSMAASKRALDPRFQAAVDVSLAGNYRDVRFTRLARRTTPRMVGGHDARTPLESNLCRLAHNCRRPNSGIRADVSDHGKPPLHSCFGVDSADSHHHRRHPALCLQYLGKINIQATKILRTQAPRRVVYADAK